MTSQLTINQQKLIESILSLDVDSVNSIAQEIDVNFMTENGFPLTILTDSLDDWWNDIQQAYMDDEPLSQAQKLEMLQPYIDIFDILVQAGANVHLWDCEEFYGPLWDATAAACVPMVEKLLALNVDPNTRDDDDLTILSSISDLWFECDFDQIDWQDALPEQNEILTFLRQNNAKMSKELTQ